MKTELLVDNDNIVLQSKERYHLDEPYCKFFAKSSKDTLDILQQEIVRIVVDDIPSPEMEG